jgi:hypothetical protein
MVLLLATPLSATTYHDSWHGATGCPDLVLFEKVLPLEKGFVLEIW